MSSSGCHFISCANGCDSERARRPWLMPKAGQGLGPIPIPPRNSNAIALGCSVVISASILVYGGIFSRMLRWPHASAEIPELRSPKRFHGANN